MTNVYLAGMIGSGKTVLGERLAVRLGRPFVDLDREMDAELGESFHRLVAERGWLAFREREYAICKRVAARRGIVMRYEWNRDALRGSGIVVLLEADLATLAARVRAADRPRINPGVSLEDDLATIWSSSAHLYRGAADLAYRTDAGRTLDEEVDDLATLLAPRLALDRR